MTWTLAPGSLGVAFSGHWLPLDAICRLVARADALGYAVVLVDGDTTLVPHRKDAAVYDTNVLASRALACSERIRVGSIRLPGFWNTLLLARSLGSLQEVSGGRALALIGAGTARHEARIGLPELSPGARVTRLEETLHALRPLLAGEEVTARGRFVTLDRAQIRLPATPVPLIVAASSPRALRLAERYGDIWDANVPPLREMLGPLQERLTRPLPTWVWVFARPGATLEQAAADYRRCCPWFADLSESVVGEALLFGERVACRERLAELPRRLGVDLPILDLAGLDERNTRIALDALAPAAPGNLS